MVWGGVGFEGAKHGASFLMKENCNLGGLYLRRCVAHVCETIVGETGLNGKGLIAGAAEILIWSVGVG